MDAIWHANGYVMWFPCAVHRRHMTQPYAFDMVSMWELYGYVIWNTWVSGANDIHTHMLAICLPIWNPCEWNMTMLLGLFLSQFALILVKIKQLFLWLYLLPERHYVRSGICYRNSVSLSSVWRLSVTFVHRTQPVEIFSNVSVPSCTVAIRWPPCKILWRSTQGNPLSGVKRKRGSLI